MPDISNNESILVIQQLQSIQTTIQELSRKQDIQNVKLFGEEGSENAMGRLPLVESQLRKHDIQLNGLEKFQARTTLIIALITFVASSLTYAIMHHYFGA